MVARERERVRTARETLGCNSSSESLTFSWFFHGRLVQATLQSKAASLPVLAPKTVWLLTAYSAD